MANEVTAGREDAEGGQTTEQAKADTSSFKIVTLQDLSFEQIEIFARAKGIADTKKFLDDIDRADAWSFTARPQDLIEVTEYWQDNGRIGSRLELMQNNVERRLQETSQDRIEDRALSDDQVPRKSCSLGSSAAAASLTLPARSGRSLGLVSMSDEGWVLSAALTLQVQYVPHCRRTRR